MKGALVVLLLCTAYTASAVPVEEHARGPYSRFIQFPDGNDVMHQVDLEETPDSELLNRISRDSADNKYLLYTKRNRDSPQRLFINDPNSISESNFDPNAPTAVIAHGWMSSESTNHNSVIRDAYLADAKGDTNVIILDWSSVAQSGYVSAARGVPFVGRDLGQFLAFLNRVSGASFDSMHLIGFSLGAHVVGHAGREVGGRIARVTGLDPAGPLWYTSSNRLGPNDGVYVEAIHTDGGTHVDSLGIGFAIADADFFPNGGSDQPGCLTPICSHNRAWQFFAASVTYDHFVSRECANIIMLNLNLCRGQELNMGNDDLNKSGSGTYRVNTRRRYPYM